MIVFKVRSWVASTLRRLARYVEPNQETAIKQAIQDQLIYGTGMVATRIPPVQLKKEDK